MKKHMYFLGFLTAVTLLAVLASAGAWFKIPTVKGASPEEVDAPQALADVDGELALYYPVKFICSDSLQAGEFWHGPSAPIVQQTTQILIHNPHDYPIDIFKRAMLAPVEETHPEMPGSWLPYALGPGEAFRIDCEDIVYLLTGVRQSVRQAYGFGVTIEGFVTIGVWPMHFSPEDTRYPQPGVTAEYVRGSEVMKKDVHYQPWWRFWWWDLPWALARPYHRLISTSPDLTCEDALHNELLQDVGNSGMLPSQRDDVVAALVNGLVYHPGFDEQVMSYLPPDYAIVALIGKCEEIVTRPEIWWSPEPSIPPAPFVPTETKLAVDYVLFSTKGPNDDPSFLDTPIEPPQEIYPYPWIPGRWHDMPVIFPQNVSEDMHAYFGDWHLNWWGYSLGYVDLPYPPLMVDAMGYFVPYWCGYGYWWQGYNGTDCVDIGVGEGESLDVEQVMPLRVIMPFPISPDQAD